MHPFTDPSYKNESKLALVWLNDWVIVYEISGCAFKSGMSHLKSCDLFLFLLQNGVSIKMKIVDSSNKLSGILYDYSILFTNLIKSFTMLLINPNGCSQVFEICPWYNWLPHRNVYIFFLRSQDQRKLRCIWTIHCVGKLSIFLTFFPFYKT